MSGRAVCDGILTLSLAGLLFMPAHTGEARQEKQRQIEIELAGQKAARAFAERFVDGAYEELSPRMTPELRVELTPGRAERARRELIDAMGNPKIIRSPRMIDAGPDNAARGRSMFLVPVVYERGTLDLGIVVDAEGKAVDFLWATRTQVPAAPPPYDASEVAFTNGRIALAGTLALPEGDGPFPAVLLVSGSGEQDRDHTAHGHRTFAVLADHLTRSGIATLRLDDRGVGGSTGSEREATLPDLAGDAAVAVRFLAGQPRIDAGRIGLVGYSYGGLVAALASQSEGVAFVVLLAVPTRPGREFGLRQAEQVWRACRGDGDAEGLERHLASYREAMDRMLSDAGRTHLSKTTRKYLKAWAPEDYEHLRSPWLRYVVSYDPRHALAATNVPVLALFGERDRQVDTDLGLADARRAFASRSDVTIEALPGLNHLLQRAETGCPGEYRWIEQTLDPGVLASVTDWILGRN